MWNSNRTLCWCGFLNATWRVRNRGHFMAGTKCIRVETLCMRNWICSRLRNTTQVSEYKLRGRAEENTAPALLTPPGLDGPYFQVKCPLLPFSALWSSPAFWLSIISFLPLFCSVGGGAVITREEVRWPVIYQISPNRRQLIVRFPFD